MPGRVGPNELGTAKADTVGPGMTDDDYPLVEHEHIEQGIRRSGKVGPSGLGTAKAVTVAPMSCST